MAPENEDMNEMFEEEMEESPVVTVPIDTTLKRSGEAAEAKAVGDALAQKADKSELSTAVTVNGQAADQQGKILVYAEHIQMSNAAGAQDLKTAVEGLQNEDAGDIPMDKTQVSGDTVKQAVQALQGANATTIKMSAEPGAQTIAKAMEDFTDAEIQQMLVDAGYEEESSNE